jgi:hypothetical protein
MKLQVCEYGLTETPVSVLHGELVDDVEILGKVLHAANMTITTTPRLPGLMARCERRLNPDEGIFHLLHCHCPEGQH